VAEDPLISVLDRLAAAEPKIAAVNIAGSIIIATGSVDRAIAVVRQWVIAFRFSLGQAFVGRS